MAGPLQLGNDELVVPPGGWTVDHLDAMPGTHVRYELTDGALAVSPSPSDLHQVTASVIWSALDAQAPDDVVVTQAVDVRFGRQLTRVPDVLVVRTDEPRRRWFAPEEVLLAVEIESPGSHVEDRVTRPAIYARYGIPSFWRVTTEPPRMRVHDLVDGTYRQVALAHHVIAFQPFPLDLDLVSRLSTRTQ